MRAEANKGKTVMRSKFRSAPKYAGKPRDTLHRSETAACENTIPQKSAQLLQACGQTFQSAHSALRLTTPHSDLLAGCFVLRGPLRALRRVRRRSQERTMQRDAVVGRQDVGA
jgi:hypothetical protein